MNDPTPVPDEDDIDDHAARRPRRKGVYILPNLFTLAALFGGFYAIVMAMNGRYEQSCYGVFCAMVLDSLDGRVARMTNTQSAFGAEMDSLSDMVSFGAAPALIVYEWALKGLGKAGWGIAFFYCACAALRLARFNTNLAVVDKRFFQGLPSPAAAALVIGFRGRDHLLRGRDDGRERAVLQLQGPEPEAFGAVHRDRADRAGDRHHQPVSGAHHLRDLLPVRRVGLLRVRVEARQGAAGERDRAVDRRARRSRAAPLIRLACGASSGVVRTLGSRRSPSPIANISRSQAEPAVLY
jgi:CDP-diacylglycerol--serine O-phosphatidyltransferase